MRIKCFLFLDQYVAPVKTLDRVFPKGTSNKEITAIAEKEFRKGFRIEIEDVKNPLHPPYDKSVSQIKLPEIEVISTQRIKVNGKIYKKADIIALHGMTDGQYNYFRCMKKYSMVEIFEKGLSLYVRKRKSQS